MSDTPLTRFPRWREVLIVAALLLLAGAVALTIRFHRQNPQWQLEMELGWRFQRYETRSRVDIQPISNTGTNLPPDWYITLARGYRAGPFHAYMLEMLPKPQPVGTNQVRVGDVLYDPTSRQELWRVLATEKQHEFDDDTIAEGVLVRSSINGGESWMPREGLGKVLVGR